VCDRGCAKVTSCPGGGKLADCTRYCPQARPEGAACREACLSLPSCSDAFNQCLSNCEPPAMVSCADSCAGCASNRVCFGGALPNSTVDYSAVCLQRCAVTADCPVGERCVQESGPSGQLAGRVCVSDPSSAALPVHCPGPIICAGTSGPSLCADSSTLQQVFFSQGNSLCGVEFIACDAGCVGSSADGGVPDGGMEARCR